MAIALLLIFALAAMTACGGAGKKEGTKKTGGTVTFGTAMDQFGNMDIHYTTAAAPFQAAMQMTEPLIGKDPDGNLFPLLLDEMPEVSEDGLTYSFKLKSGVKFHDGSLLDSGDVKATFEKMLNPKNLSVHAGSITTLIKGAAEYADGKADSISGIEVKDDQNFTITLVSPNASFLNFLSAWQMSIYPAEAATMDGWGTKVFIGTGPYKLKEFEPNSKIVMERFDDYHGGAKKLDSIVFQNMTQNTALMEFEAGNIDLTEVKDTAIISSYLENEEFKDNIVMIEQLGTIALSFNMKMKPFDNPKVREAISIAIDRETIVNKLLKGLGTPAKSFLPKGVLGYDEDLEEFKYDPERAKQLLKEAGYPDGIDVEAITTDTAATTFILQYLAEAFKEANIRMTIQTYDAAGFTDIRNNGKIPMFILTWVSDVGDPNDFMSLYSTPMSQFISNFYENSEYDAQLQKGLTETDLEKRAELYRQLDYKLTRTDYACAPIYHPNAFMLVSKKIKNLRMENCFRLFDAELSE